MKNTLLTTKELACRIKFSSSYINAGLRDTVFIEGLHYIRPFNGKKILYLWEAVEAELYSATSRKSQIIPMARGGICHG